MKKYCFINLVLLAIIFNACNFNKSISSEAERFERVLEQNLIKHEDRVVKYVIWNENSCIGCKNRSLNFVNQCRLENVKIIVPNSDNKLVENNDTTFLMKDEGNRFGKYYYGIGNIGIIKVKQGKVISIKNYDVDDMEIFEKDMMQ